MLITDNRAITANTNTLQNISKKGELFAATLIPKEFKTLKK